MRTITPLLLAVCTLVLFGCEEEGPAISETTAGEASVVGTELEEDARLSDDMPLGEPEVFDTAHQGVPPSPDAGAISPEASVAHPVPAAIQEMPSLPGGDAPELARPAPDAAQQHSGAPHPE